MKTDELNKESINSEQPANVINIIEPDTDHGLPKKELFRVDEVASYFGISERCVRLWIDHGHLQCEKIVGSIRITRGSILRCRFRNKN